MFFPLNCHHLYERLGPYASFIPLSVALLTISVGVTPACPALSIYFVTLSTHCVRLDVSPATSAPFKVSECEGVSVVFFSQATARTCMPQCVLSLHSLHLSLSHSCLLPANWFMCVCVCLRCIFASEFPGVCVNKCVRVCVTDSRFSATGRRCVCCSDAHSVGSFGFQPSRGTR